MTTAKNRASTLLCTAALMPLLAGFSSTSLFDTPTSKGGGGGVAFTGSPTSHGLSCASCHQGTIRTKGIDLWSVPDGLFAAGFVAGTTYTIHLRIADERRGRARNGACPPAQGGCNRNGFVAEILDDAGGEVVGAVCVDDGAYDSAGKCSVGSGTTTATLDHGAGISGHSLAQPRVCDAVVTTACIDVAALRAVGASEATINATLANGVYGRTDWTFQWRAPQDTAATARLWLGVVDGDGGLGPDPAHNDYAGDEVYLLNLPIWAAGIDNPPAAGCNARPGRLGAQLGGGGGGGGGGATLILLLAGALWLLAVRSTAWRCGINRRDEMDANAQRGGDATD